MRIFLLLISLFSIHEFHAQEDSSAFFRLEVYPLLNLGLNYQSIKAQSNDDISHLIQYDRSIAGYMQPLAIEVHVKNRAFLHASVKAGSLGLNREKAFNDLKARYPHYFVQEESKYQWDSGTTYEPASYLTYQLGLGMSFPLKEDLCLQPFVAYNTGTSKGSGGRYSFKEYTSNYFFVNDYKPESSRTNGYSLTLRLNYYVTDQSEAEMKALSMVYLLVSFSHLETNGWGTIERKDIFLNESITPYYYSKVFNLFSIGGGVGFGSRMYKKGRPRE